MKIKRREYEALKARLAELERMAATRIVIGSKAGDLLDQTMEHLAVMARFGGGVQTRKMIRGLTTFSVIAPEHASGYEHFLISKYTDQDDAPWNAFSKIKLTEDENSVSPAGWPRGINIRFGSFLDTPSDNP